MKRNIHVGPACDRLIAQIRARARSLNEQRDIFERIARLPFAEPADTTLAAEVNQAADSIEPSVNAEAKALEHARGVERDAKNLSAASAKMRK
jgi:hypothetical protein